MEPFADSKLIYLVLVNLSKSIFAKLLFSSPCFTQIQVNNSITHNDLNACIVQAIKTSEFEEVLLWRKVNYLIHPNDLFFHLRKFIACTSHCTTKICWICLTNTGSNDLELKCCELLPFPPKRDFWCVLWRKSCVTGSTHAEWTESDALRRHV